MKSLITEPLGLFGWKKLEPVLLAALSTKLPLLLVGKHGCAKSFILERLSESLKLEYRFYNASLINYDDLVGIPIPSEDHKTLEYITNSTSIWDAEVVFIDEINRTKPELQNKLFPIIYDKRIQGQDLKKLKYRFAAMNPPSDDEDEENSYYGAMPLDAALCDRFPFIVKVPEWNDLSEDDTRNMLKDQFEGRHEFPIDIKNLVKECEETYKKVIKEHQDETIKYIQTLTNNILQTIGYISPRRATMLEETLLSIHAARIVLNNYSDIKQDITFEDSIYLAIENTLPFNTNSNIDKSKLYALARQAYQISKLEDCAEKRMLEIINNEDKFVFMVKNQKDINNITLSETILSNLSSFEDKKRRAIALLGYLSFRNNADILASAIETLIEQAKPCIEPKSIKSLGILKKVHYAQHITELNQEINENEEMRFFRNNLLQSYLPDGYNDQNEIDELSSFFKNIWERIHE